MINEAIETNMCFIEVSNKVITIRITTSILSITFCFIKNGAKGNRQYSKNILDQMQVAVVEIFAN